MRKKLSERHNPEAISALPHNPLDGVHGQTLSFLSPPDTNHNPAFSARLFVASTLSEYLCWRTILYKGFTSAVARGQ